MKVRRWVSATTLDRQLVAYSATSQGAKEKMKLALGNGERLEGPLVMESPETTPRVVDNRKAPGS